MQGVSVTDETGRIETGGDISQRRSVVNVSVSEVDEKRMRDMQAVNDV